MKIYRRFSLLGIRRAHVGEKVQGPQSPGEVCLVGVISLHRHATRSATRSLADLAFSSECWKHQPTGHRRRSAASLVNTGVVAPSSFCTYCLTASLGTSTPELSSRDRDPSPENLAHLAPYRKFSELCFTSPSLQREPLLQGSCQTLRFSSTWSSGMTASMPVH